MVRGLRRKGERVVWRQSKMPGKKRGVGKGRDNSDNGMDQGMQPDNLTEPVLALKRGYTTSYLQTTKEKRQSHKPSMTGDTACVW